MTIEQIYADVNIRLERVRELQRQVEIARQHLALASNECLAGLEAFRAAIHRISEASQPSTAVHVSEPDRPNDQDERPLGPNHAPDSQQGT